MPTPLAHESRGTRTCSARRSERSKARSPPCLSRYSTNCARIGDKGRRARRLDPPGHGEPRGSEVRTTTPAVRSARCHRAVSGSHPRGPTYRAEKASTRSRVSIVPSAAEPNRLRKRRTQCRYPLMVPGVRPPARHSFCDLPVENIGSSTHHALHRVGRPNCDTRYRERLRARLPRITPRRSRCSG